MSQMMFMISDDWGVNMEKASFSNPDYNFQSKKKGKIVNLFSIAGIQTQIYFILIVPT